MKEKYFSNDTIDSKTSEMLEKVKAVIPRLKEQEFIPKKSALLVIDMQKYFCDESSIPFVPSSPAIIPKINRLIEEYNSKKLPVIFTRQMNTPLDAGMMAKWWKYAISPESEMCEITPELITDNALILDKTQYDSFHNTNLESVLKEKNISQLVITGLLTHLCCESTARGAFVRGFETFYCIDGMVTYKEIFHLSSMINMAHGCSSLVMTEDICKKVNYRNE